MLSHRLLTALRRLGLQWRIMLYVTTGLVVFSAVGAFIALRAVQQSTDLVYQERLHVARMVARHIDDQLARLPAAERAPNGGWLASLLDIGQGYTSEVIDQAGAVMVTTSKRGAPAFSLHLPLVMGLWQQNQAGVRLHTFQVNGETRGHVIAFVPLAQAAWGVIIEQEADEALRLPRDLQAQFVSFGAAAALAGLLLAWVTTRRVVRPINALIDASQDIARGDLDHPLDISGEAEVGALARTFNQMRVALKGSREEIARWNRELEARVQQRTRELATLVESAHALTSTLDLDALFSILMKQAREVLPLAEGIALFLFEPESQMLAVRSSSGFNASEAAGLRFRIGEAIAGKVFEAQAPALLQTMQAVRSYQANFSVDNRLRFQRAVGARQPGTSGGLRAPQSALGVPLVSKETRIGALLLYNFTREEAFGEGDVPILQALADQAVAAIENARLYQEASEVGTLRELNRLKSEFAARASHELRTPLTSIKSLAETLLRSDLRLDEATRRELLRGIDSAADRLTGIVNDLLMLARIEAGQLEVQHEPVALDTLIGEMAAQFASQFPSHHFQVETANPLPPALGDPERLDDVLSNLLSNAVKYSEPGTTVRVSASLAPTPDWIGGATEVVITVGDEGIGIPQDEWPRLFERFYRVDNALTRHTGGAGLGLFICKTYVEAMRGRIWVENSAKAPDGRGTVFAVALPIA